MPPVHVSLSSSLPPTSPLCGQWWSLTLPPQSYTALSDCWGWMETCVEGGIAAGYVDMWMGR